MKELKLYPHTFFNLGSFFIMMVCLVSFLSGCQYFSKSASESSLDAQLSKTSPPSAQIPMANGEPQKGFEQQPSGEPTR